MLLGGEVELARASRGLGHRDVARPLQRLLDVELLGPPRLRELAASGVEHARDRGEGAELQVLRPHLRGLGQELIGRDRAEAGQAARSLPGSAGVVRSEAIHVIGHALGPRRARDPRDEVEERRHGAGVVGTRVGWKVGRRLDVEHDPAQVVARPLHEDAVDGGTQRKVVEHPTVDGPTPDVERRVTGEIGTAADDGPGAGTRVDPEVARLEHGGDGRRGASGRGEQVDPAVTREVVAFALVRVVADEGERVVVPALADRLVEVVVAGAGLARHGGHGDQQVDRPGVGGIADEAPVRRPSPERVAELPDEVVVALQEGRRVRLVGRAQQCVDVADVEPDVADRHEALDREVEVPGGGEDRPVEAAGAGAGDHVDAWRREGQLEQAPVDRRRHVGRGIGVACRHEHPVELGGDAAHPHREARPAGHDGGDAQLACEGIRGGVGHPPLLGQPGSRGSVPSAEGRGGEPGRPRRSQAFARTLTISTANVRRGPS